MNVTEKRGITSAAACHALVHVLELAYGVVLIAIATDLGITLLALGVLANIFGLAYGITALPIGVIADRKSATKMLGMCALAIGVAAILMSIARSQIALGVGLTVLGVALGVFHPVANAFISKIASRVGLGFAYLGIGGTLGVSVGPVVVGAIASGSNWRIAYAVMAVPAIVLGVIFLRFRNGGGQAPEQVPLHLATAPTSLREFFAPLVVVVLLGTLTGLVYRAVVTFLPTHLSASVGAGGAETGSVLLAGSFTTVALLFGVVGQFLGGYLCDRWSREGIVLLSIAVTVPALVAVWATGGPLLLAAAALFAFFYFMSQPVFNALIADYTPVHWRGRMFGIYFFCSLAVGSFSATGLGYVAETHGIASVFLACAIIALAATVVSVPLVVWARRRAHEKHRLEVL